MKTEEDEEFERIEAESGWRKRQIALDQKAENARELGLDYKPQRTWVGLTLTQVKLLGEGVHEEAIKSGDSYNWVFYKHINEALKEKNK